MASINSYKLIKKINKHDLGRGLSMGMMIAGKWHNHDDIHQGDEYQRPVSNCHVDINPDEILHSQRFHLIASFSCPWSHRVMLYRVLAGLEDYIPLHITSGKTAQGYSANNGEMWQIPGAQKQADTVIEHLHQLYRFNDQQYTGRSTVPILWDSHKLQIVSNESSHLIELLEKAGERLNAPTSQASLESELINKDELSAFNQDIYHQLSNGVYKAAFAKSQHAYDKAVTGVFSMLNLLDQCLADSRYLMGDAPCQADWLLFPTLVRFDIDYYLHSGCCLKQLRDYQHLWRYVRTLYNTAGIAQTVNFAAIHASNYQTNQILPAMPTQDWSI
jgi:putative glutathione S-transferase